ncbi:CGNR zinc finger domain-containing protein [Cellulomonas sp. McL0617]|uniref:CGNR zinc finger domain-containing protein n=1 Tax=Cellulomonas sp. McL0617 TaxID=3415675 RepID=UPI003CEE3FD7
MLDDRLRQPSQDEARLRRQVGPDRDLNAPKPPRRSSHRRRWTAGSSSPGVSAPRPVPRPRTSVVRSRAPGRLHSSRVTRRRCADGARTRLFLDPSHGRRRLWCGMRGCGDRAQAGAHRARHVSRARARNARGDREAAGH